MKISLWLASKHTLVKLISYRDPKIKKGLVAGWWGRTPLFSPLRRQGLTDSQGYTKKPRPPPKRPSWVRSAKETATVPCLSSARANLRWSTGPQICLLGNPYPISTVPHPPEIPLSRIPTPKTWAEGIYLKLYQGERSESCPATEAWRDGEVAVSTGCKLLPLAARTRREMSPSWTSSTATAHSPSIHKAMGPTPGNLHCTSPSRAEGRQKWV